MSFIKILVNDLEVDFVKETLTIKKENNSLISDFSVSHNSYPFLVVENARTLEALGPRDISSTLKNKLVPVTVIELGRVYYGELQILSFIKGFRKCNLKYSSDLLTIINKPIKNYLPIVSVIPDETDPEPYVKESNTVIEGYENWETYPIQFLQKIYPQTKWQFPTMFWENRIENPEDAPEWEDFNSEVNRIIYNQSQGAFLYLENDFTLDGVNLSVTNKNVAMPQLFLLSPLFYALEFIGWRLTGNFTENPFIRRLLLLSQEDNLTKIELNPDPVIIDFSPWAWDYIQYPGSNLIFPRVSQDVPITAAGSYTINFSLTLNPDPRESAIVYMTYSQNGQHTIFFNQDLSNLNAPQTIEGSHTVEMPGGSFPRNLSIHFHSYHLHQPSAYSIEVVSDADTQEFYEMHPTIDFSRYCPSWSVGEYINQLKTLFNLDVNIDDFKKQLVMNFNEPKTLLNPPEIVNKSLKIDNYDIAANTSFLLKYGNTEDTALYITRTETAIENFTADNFTKEIKSGFKKVPSNGNTALLSENLKSKAGVGLMIYNPDNSPFTSQEYNGQNLTIDETGGIYDTYYKKWLKFRLNASYVELTGPFTEQELTTFSEAQEIYIDGQHYKVISMAITEDKANQIKTKFALESVTV